MTEDSASGRAPTVGTELGGYRIESLLGRGGMGVVYRALDLALDRNVALKLLAPELAEDVAFRERFHRESRLAAALDHPAIVPIYDAGEVAGQLYIAMRLVEGTDLKRLLAEGGTLEPERAVELLQPIADALDAAHERGLVHRDVKPSNILIDERGHSYLADFGLSRRLADAGDLVGDGMTLGTIDYVSPEQIRGEELDGRADLYSLGCILYECLAGRPPFAGSDTVVVFAHLEEDPPALSNADVVVRKALAKNPGDRYQSGRELIQAAREQLGLVDRGRSPWLLAAVVISVAVMAVVVLAAILARGPGGAKADPNADTLSRIDPKTNEITTTMRVGNQASGVSATDSHVWVANYADGTIWRIDPETKATVKIPVSGSPTGVAAGTSVVLVANGPEHDIASIDPDTASVRFVRPLTGNTAGTPQVAVDPQDDAPRFADGAEGVYADLYDASAPTDPIPTFDIPRDESNVLSAYRTFSDMAVDRRHVWVLGDAFGRSVWRSRSGSDAAVITTISLPFVPGAIAAGDGGVWVTSLLGDTISRIDPDTGALVATVRVPAGVTDLAVGNGVVWVASSAARVISRIDPKTNRVVARIPTEGTPTAIAVGPKDVWLTTTAPDPIVPEGVIGIGVIADCSGPVGAWYEQSLAGAELPLLDRGGRRGGANAGGIVGARIAGKPVHLALGCADGTGTSALREARRLVEQVGVRVLVGPTRADEQLALAEYAQRRPDVVFVNTAAGQQLRPPPNVFSFTLDGAGWAAGLGAYAYKKLGWRTAVTVTDFDDPSFNWAQAAGFAAEFCSLGGTIAGHVAVPPNSQEYATTVAPIPTKGVDGIFAAAGQSTVLTLARSYPGFRGRLSKKLLVGALGSPALKDLDQEAWGIAEGIPWLSEGERRYRYGVDLAKYFPARFPSLGFFDITYRDAMTAVVTALARTGGDLSGNAEALRRALADLTLHSPLGRIRLDADRQAIGTSRLVRFPESTIVRRVAGIEHTYDGYFSADDPAPSTATPTCKHGDPPPWAR